MIKKSKAIDSLLSLQAKEEQEASDREVTVETETEGTDKEEEGKKLAIIVILHQVHQVHLHPVALDLHHLHHLNLVANMKKKAEDEVN